jgi:DNA-binding NarL/FixJ family response regulator
MSEQRQDVGRRRVLIAEDLSMPVLNGLEATRLLAELLPGTPVVIFTADDSPDLHRAVREAGAAGYLVKDVGVDELVAALDRS